MRISHLALATAILALSPVSASAQDMPYRDDRSSAAGLIESFYNAVNRREFARAWSYYGEEKPAADLDAFSTGYDDTASVSVLTGDVASEGAAGSTFYYLPVAIAATDRSGSQTVFAGCYVARLANPSIQGEPFVPLHIQKGTLTASGTSLEDALPKTCPDAPAPEQTDGVLEDARTMFAEAAPYCSRDSVRGDPTAIPPEQYRISYNYTSDAEDQPKREARIFRFFCNSGAYNETHVYYQFDEDSGLRQIQFASPELDIRYQDDTTNEKVESITTIGYVTDAELVNSSYDEATLSITSNNNWRGVGDASDSGTWIFRNGRFTLVKYDVDASYDGEIDPETILDLESGP